MITLIDFEAINIKDKKLIKSYNGHMLIMKDCIITATITGAHAFEVLKPGEDSFKLFTNLIHLYSCNITYKAKKGEILRAVKREIL